MGEGRLNRPEDLCFDEEGILYTVTRDGWIERMHRNGSWEQWVLVGGPSLLGIATSSTGAILLCDADKVCTQYFVLISKSVQQKLGLKAIIFSGF